MIEALIIMIAVEVGIPPYFALSIAYTENSTLDPMAVNVNPDGTLDRGVMQLNSSWYNGAWWDPEENIRAGCQHIKWLLSLPGMNCWLVAVAYNCGYYRLEKGKPPESSIDYAVRVFARFNEYRGYKW
jgi:soluble lytic murein transglycosylase-like protein